MGEVYRARDTRLDRDVAVKVLPARKAVECAAQVARGLAAGSEPNDQPVQWSVDAGITSAPVTPDLSVRVITFQRVRSDLYRVEGLR
jgi:hypothetical protein